MLTNLIIIFVRYLGKDLADLDSNSELVQFFNPASIKK
jgi:hypothetical protein